MLRDAGNQGHVVIDDQDGQPLGGDAVEQVVQRPLLARIEAGRRLVEQQHRRIGGQRARDLDQALMAVAEARDRLAARGPRARRNRARRWARRRNAVGAWPRPARCRRVRRRSRHFRARSSSGTAGCSGTCARGRRRCACARGRRGHVDAVDENRARRRAIKPGDDIERRRLAAAVRADQRMHAAAPHLKIDAVDRLQAAEILGEPSDLQRDRSAGIGGAQARAARRPPARRALRL